MSVVWNLLEVQRAENYADLINNMLTAYQRKGCRCLFKSTSGILTLIPHVILPMDLVAISDDKSERFPHDISEMALRLSSAKTELVVITFVSYN